MKDTIFLVMNRRGVVKMTKTMVPVGRDQIVSKINVSVPESAFRPPVVEKSIVIEDWRDGTDLEDVQFRRDIITAEEAEMIRRKRLAKMREILEDQGYKIIVPDERDDDEPSGGNDPETQ